MPFDLGDVIRLTYLFHTGTFYCDGGNCVGEDKVCNGHTDCYDGSDELHCPHGLVNQHTVAVQGLTVDEEEVTSHSVKVHWWIAGTIHVCIFHNLYLLNAHSKEKYQKAYLMTIT